jgi:3-methyladenine DNA glycosylase AlkD
MIARYKKQLRTQLKRIAKPETKAWFEAYMKHQERYLGVKTPAVEKTIITLAAQLSNQISQKLCFSLLESPFTEEKLAGMILYQKKLIKNSSSSWQQDLKSIKKITEAGYISWWNTCDWLCMRVLGRIIAEQGKHAALLVSSWIDSDNLWLKRMSLVSFVNHAKKGDQLFKGNQKIILTNAQRLVLSSERFHQTAVGWVIREVYKGDPKTAQQFIVRNQSHFSREGLRYAIEKMPEAERKRILAQRVIV